MADDLETLLRKAEADKRLGGLTLWRTSAGRWQGNVRHPDNDGWCCMVADDPVDALRAALTGKQIVAAVHPPAKDADGGAFG